LPTISNHSLLRYFLPPSLPPFNAQKRDSESTLSQRNILVEALQAENEDLEKLYQAECAVTKELKERLLLSSAGKGTGLKDIFDEVVDRYS
jgi:hypothetical protein